jgi:hypothetical protein
VNDLPYRLAYFSRSTLAGPPDALDAEVQRILTTSRRNNTATGVTGALLFNSSCFAQVLEGQLEAVETTFERIQRDQRHTDVTVLELTQVAEHGFATWSMAFAGKIDERQTNFEVLTAASIERTGTANQIFDLLHGLVQREQSVP